MFEALGHFIFRNRKRVLALSILTVILAGGVGSLVFPKLSSGGYSNPKSDSARADAYVTNTFHIKDPAISIVVDTKGRSLSNPTVIADEAALEKSVAGLATVTKTVSYWSAGNTSSLASSDGHAGYLLIYTSAVDPTTSTDLASQLQKSYDGSYKSLSIYVGGGSTIYNAISTKIKKDLGVAEAISIPLTFLFLLFIFGGLISSAMPLVVGVSAILGTFFFLYIISLFTGVSIFALNLTTGMGLGLGIDYSLLIVNRFREELHAGNSVEESIVQTVATAGRTVFFSGITVFVTLASLLFFPLMFLRSFGYAGVAVVAMAVLGALIPLPAMLAILGTRIDSFVVRKSAITPKSDGRWAATARFVMKRPVAIVLACLVVLGIFAAPLKDIAFSQVDSRALPATNPAAMADAQSLARFSSQEASPIHLIIPHASANAALIPGYLAAVAKISNVVGVGKESTANDFLSVDLYDKVGARTNAAQSMITAIRAVKAPAGTLVGGAAADYTDTQEGIAHTMPLAFGWIALSVLILLFLFTGSIILPIKAVLLNVVSLSASLGLVTWIFIDGHMTWLVGKFTNVGSLDTGMVILTAVVTFALSMDYEVFLLSRIKEEHDGGHSNIESVATGLQRSARIITAAALLLAVVFAAFITSGVTSIKILGLGVAFAVLVDATIVRALLVPALMRLFGDLNWWAPKALKRFSIKH
jgi:RND superfamily putative drug exporter